MILAQELVNRIRDYFNLNLYETKVWLALLSKGIASVGEVAAISRVPRSRAYDVLESLEKKGFAITKMGKPVKYLGVKPQIILERIKADIRKNAEERVKDLAKIKETEEFMKLEKLYEQGINPAKRENISALLRGKSNIFNFLRDMLRNAKKEVIICGDAEEVKLKIRLFQQTFKNLKDANVKIKFVLSGDNNVIKQIENKLNTKIERVNFNAKFFIVDKKEILFYLSKNSEEDSVIWLNSEFFAEAFALLFENACKKK
jgi:sugar-specific transcriptional regulator TrmB